MTNSRCICFTTLSSLWNLLKAAGEYYCYKRKLQWKTHQREQRIMFRNQAKWKDVEINKIIYNECINDYCCRWKCKHRLNVQMLWESPPVSNLLFYKHMHCIVRIVTYLVLRFCVCALLQMVHPLALLSNLAFIKLIVIHESNVPG
jgi:hypothetical protein